MENALSIITITSDAPAMVLAPEVEPMRSVSDTGTVIIGTTISQDQRIRTK